MKYHVDAHLRYIKIIQGKNITNSWKGRAGRKGRRRKRGKEDLCAKKHVGGSGSLEKAAVELARRRDACTRSKCRWFFFLSQRRLFSTGDYFRGGLVTRFRRGFSASLRQMASATPSFSSASSSGKRADRGAGSPEAPTPVVSSSSLGFQENSNSQIFPLCPRSNAKKKSLDRTIDRM